MTHEDSEYVFSFEIGQTNRQNHRQTESCQHPVPYYNIDQTTYRKGLSKHIGTIKHTRCVAHSKCTTRKVYRNLIIPSQGPSECLFLSSLDLKSHFEGKLDLVLDFCGTNI